MEFLNKTESGGLNAFIPHVVYRNLTINALMEVVSRVKQVKSKEKYSIILKLIKKKITIIVESLEES